MKAGKKSTYDSERLFSLLIEPLNLPLSADSLAIVPDGVLHLLPFSALQQLAGGYLASHHTIWYLPSAGTLVLLRSRHSPEAPRMFLGVGGVEYTREPDMTALAQVKQGLTRADYYDIDFTQLPNLPGTAEEVRAAAEIVGAGDSKLLVGRNGTESEFKSAGLSDYRILHLAVHGKANVKNPDRAALVLRPNPPEEDGLLEPREILGLHLKADLVVLSACDTAVGHLQGEEGIANLARAFLTAGSESVISTLWPIDDTYSLFLMKRFYIHLRDGSTEAEALRISQADLLDKFGRETPPIAWAAFTLLGDGDHAIFPAKRSRVTPR